MTERDTPSEQGKVESAKGEIRNYLGKNKWELCKCASCNSEYFSKKQTDSGNCETFSCEGYKFLEKPRKKGYLTTDSLNSQFNSFFENQNYAKALPIPILIGSGKTLFTGTGGQIFNSAIMEEREYDPRKFNVAQPVIRFQGEQSVGKIDGFSTSFVNLATEQVNATINDHLSHFDNWLNWLSNLGIYMGDVTMKLSDSHPNWGKGSFNISVVKMYYGGLEIGVVNYSIDVPQNTRPNLSISDLTFGLERIAWAVNKTPSYYDIVGPISLSAKNKHVEMDSYRTMVLMAGSGVNPSNKDRGSKFRLLSKKIADLGEAYPTGLVSYYDNWWRNFMDLPIKPEDVNRIMQGERNRNINLLMQEKLNLTRKMDLSIDQSPDVYIQQLLTKGISVDKIRKAIQEGERSLW